MGWNMVSGPAAVVFSHPNNLVTNATFSAAGVYTLRLTANDSVLTATDDLIVTVSAVNQAPIVNVGPDQQVFSPTNQLSVIASVTDDGLPANAALALAWSKVSGPGEVSFAPADNLATTATFSTQGTYVLRLTASDSLLSASDELTVTVGCSANTTNLDIAFVIDVSGSFQGQPIADAKAAAKTLVDRLQLATNDQAAVISFTDFGTLRQPLTRDANQIKTSLDALVTGGGTIIDSGLTVALQELTSVRRQPNSQPVIILMTDGGGGVSYIQPLRNAGIRVISIANGPAMNLNALGDLRRVASSPNDFFIAPTGADLNLIYAYLAGSLCRNLPPLANAGADQNVVLPNTATLLGTASDDGVPIPQVTTRWKQVSGPATATLLTPDQLVTEVILPTAGAYTFRLTASGTVHSTTDDIVVNGLTEPTLTGATLTLATINNLSNPINTSVSITATLKDSNNQPIPNFGIRLNLTGANVTNLSSATGTTNNNGQFNFTYSGANTGVDVLNAVAQNSIQSLTSNQLSLTWDETADYPVAIQGWIGSPLNGSCATGVFPIIVAGDISVTEGFIRVCYKNNGSIDCPIIASDLAGGPGAVLTTIDSTQLHEFGQMREVA